MARGLSRRSSILDSLISFGCSKTRARLIPAIQNYLDILHSTKHTSSSLLISLFGMQSIRYRTAY
jgi:hypothetical protein